MVPNCASGSWDLKLRQELGDLGWCRNSLLAFVQRVLLPDRLLKSGRLFGPDGKNLGELELTDDLLDHIHGVDDAGRVWEDHVPRCRAGAKPSGMLVQAAVNSVRLSTQE